jgi:hypothetical protein
MPDYYGGYPQYAPGPPGYDARGQVYQNQYDQLMRQFEQLRQQQQQQMAYQQPAPGYRPQQPATAPGYTVRPAANVEEVRATPIEPMTTNVFVNPAQGEIYLSRIDDMGLKDISTYRLEQKTPEEKTEAAPSRVIDLSEVYARFDRLESMMGGAVNESVAGSYAGEARRAKPAGGLNGTAQADGGRKSAGTEAARYGTGENTSGDQPARA